MEGSRRYLSDMCQNGAILAFSQTPFDLLKNLRYAFALREDYAIFCLESTRFNETTFSTYKKLDLRKKYLWSFFLLEKHEEAAEASSDQ